MSKSNRLEIVLLAYHFPPLAGMASNRAARFVNELTARGHRVTVVTGTGDPPLEGPCMQVHDEVRIVRAGRRQLSGGVRAARSALPASVGGTRDDSSAHRSREQRLRRWVRDWVYLPDAQIAWFPAALRACRHELAEMSDPVLWTTSVPYTCHLVGAALQRRTGVRWVAEFRDPWAHAQDVGLRSPRRAAIDRRMERTIVRRPDVLLFTTDETLDLFASDHGGSIRSRAGVVPNTWRRSEFLPPDPPGPDEPLRLVYAGSINHVQHPGPLMDAVRHVSSESSGGVELHVYGEARGWKAGDAIHLHGPVAPETVPQYLSSASAVVMLAPGADYRPILLGKTMDWLGSHQPCLAIVETDGAMANLVREAQGGFVCSANTIDDVEMGVRVLLDAHRAGDLDDLRPRPQVADQFEVGTVTDRLIEELSRAKVLA